MVRFAGCRLATALDRARAPGEGPVPGETSDGAAVLQTNGGAHEIRYLHHLKTSGRHLVEVCRGLPLEEGVAETRRLLAQGAQVIHQAALLSGSWGGWTDFLERVEHLFCLGDYSYELIDAADALIAVGALYRVKKSVALAYEFPENCKL